MEDVNYVALQFYLSVAQFAMFVAGIIYVWITRNQEGNADEIKILDVKVDEMEKPPILKMGS